MPDCGDIALGTIASYAKFRMNLSSCWFSPLGIDDRFISGDPKTLHFKAVGHKLSVSEISLVCRRVSNLF